MDFGSPIMAKTHYLGRNHEKRVDGTIQVRLFVYKYLDSFTGPL